MIEIKSVNKVFYQGDKQIHALKDINLFIPQGTIFGVIGSSGAGKSTLIRCVNMLEKPTSGQVIVDGVDLTTLSNPQLCAARRNIGMIFQHFNLLSSRTVFENVALPLELAGQSQQHIETKVTELLALVGLSEKERATRRIFLAARSNVSRLPALWQAIPKSCCAMKPPARWIQQQRSRF